MAHASHVSQKIVPHTTYIRGQSPEHAPGIGICRDRRDCYDIAYIFY